MSSKLPKDTNEAFLCVQLEAMSSRKTRIQPQALSEYTMSRIPRH